MRKLALALIFSLLPLAAQTQLNISQRQLRGTGVAIGSLPATPTTGEYGQINDGASAGDCVTGSGSIDVLCRYDGSVWAPVSGAAISANSIGTAEIDETAAYVFSALGATTSTVSVTSPIFVSDNADPGDAGIIRLGNLESLNWEVSPTGTDKTILLDSNNNFQVDATWIISAGNLLVSNGDITVTGGFGSFTGLRFGDGDMEIYESADDKLRFDPGIDSADCFQFLDADGGTPMLNIDCTNGRLTTAGVQVPPSSATEPENCATAVLGASYYDTGDNTICFCVEDGTDTEWVKITDPTHTGHCSI